jgi:hypothetical protein
MTILPRPSSLIFCALLLLNGALCLSGRAAAADSPTDPVLVLPNMKVTTTSDLPPPESWRYAKVGNFEVLSNAFDKGTRDLLADFAKFTQAMTLVWPAPTTPLASSTIILCGKGGKFDGFPPAGATKNDAIVPSLFLRNREQIAIVVDLEADRIAVDPTTVDVVNAGSADYEVDHYKQLYREYVRYLLSQAQVRAPVWLEEGLAQITMDIELNDTSLIYGKIVTQKGAASGGESADSDGTDPMANTDAVVGEQPFNVVLQHRKLIPLDKFFALTADSPEAHSPLGNNLWAKQAYLFVHFCLFGEDLRYQQPLRTFISRLAHEPLSEPLFKECFKVGYDDMAKELRGYILRTKHKYQRYELKNDDRLTAKSIDLRDATQAEIGVIKGDALRLGGHEQEAYAAYRDAFLRGERSPPLLAALGVAENTAGHADRAEPLLEAAMKAGVNRPSAYIELARLRLAAFTAKSETRLSPVQIGAVLKPLFTARQNPPPLPETYELIAATWAKSATTPSADNLAVLDEGIKRFPRDSGLQCAAVQLYASIGSTAKAAAIAQFGLRYVTDETGRAKLQALLATLPAPAAK